MLLYIIMSFVIFAIVVLYENNVEYNNYCKTAKVINAKTGRLRLLKNSALIFFVFLFVLTGWRSQNIGNDTVNYIRYFLIYNEDANANYFEAGYRFLCRLIGKISSDPHVFLIIIAAVCYIPLIVYINRYSENIPVAICLFYAVFFSIYLNTLRQAIAMVIGLYAYRALKNRKLFLAILLILFASLFHASSLILLVLLFYKWIPKKYKSVFLISMIILVLSFSGIVEKYVSLLIPKYAHYFESDYADSGYLAVTASVGFAIIIYLIVYMNYLENLKDDNAKLLLSVCSIFLFINALGYMVNLFTRSSQYFYLIILMEYPSVTKNSKNRKMLNICSCLLLLMYFIVILYFRPYWNNIYPYEFWS